MLLYIQHTVSLEINLQLSQLSLHTFPLYSITKNPNQTTIKKEIRSHAAYLQELWRGQGVRKLKTPGEGRR